MQAINTVDFQAKLNNGSAAIRPFTTPFVDPEIGKLLIVIAEARQASVTAETLRVYGKALASHAVQDVRSGLVQIAQRPKREGETAFPDLGTVLQAVSAAQRERLRATRERKILSDMDASKVHWLRERAEDIAQGIERKPLSPELQQLAERLGLTGSDAAKEGAACRIRA